MHLLPGSFDAYPVSEELESSSLSRWERTPLRPLLAVSLLLALAIGAMVYLRRSHVTESAPQSSAATASPATEPTDDPDLSGDAAEHALRAHHIISGAVRDLRDAESKLEAVRSNRRFSLPEMDQAEEKVRAARRKLEASLTDIKTVGALVGK